MNPLSIRNTGELLQIIFADVSASTTVDVKVYSIDGKVSIHPIHVTYANRWVANTSQLPAGVYVVEARLDGRREVKAFSFQR